MCAEDVVRIFGFDPDTVSKQVRCFGVIDSGPRKGFLCVFTEDIELDEHALRKPNFADADRGYDPFGSGRELVYIFAPRGDRRAA
jgi:hypothetical protein